MPKVFLHIFANHALMLGEITALAEMLSPYRGFLYRHDRRIIFTDEAIHKCVTQNFDPQQIYGLELYGYKCYDYVSLSDTQINMIRQRIR